MNQGNGKYISPPPESFFTGIKNRVLQLLGRILPGYASLRVVLHRWRGVRIGTGVSIGYDVVLETAHPDWISIGNNIQVGMRSTLIAHMTQMRSLPWNAHSGEFISIRIEDDVHLGPGVIILPRVTIGRGAVVAAGSVVTRSVPPMMLVQGNPAKPVARCGIPLLAHTDWNDFVCNLRPLRPGGSSKSAPETQDTGADEGSSTQGIPVSEPSAK